MLHIPSEVPDQTITLIKLLFAGHNNQAALLANDLCVAYETNNKSISLFDFKIAEIILEIYMEKHKYHPAKEKESTISPPFEPFSV